MSDFFQHGLISTLHRLVPPPSQDGQLPAQAGTGLVMPCHYDEIGTPALDRIVAELNQTAAVDQVIVSINGVPPGGEVIFPKLKNAHALLLNDEVPSFLPDPHLEIKTGKGLNLWMAIGYAAVHTKLKRLIVHDSDIADYNLSLLATLSDPVLRLNYQYSKGYYSRVKEILYGRVTRLFVIPLIRALVRVLGHTPLLDFLDSFRYPLAGEYCLTIDLAMEMPIENGWAVEIGSLCELHRLVDPESICQVDLAMRYDHKHQLLDPAKPDRGLLWMANEIALSLLTQMEREGISLDPRVLGAIKNAYRRSALDLVRRYQDVATFNELKFDFEKESQTTHHFGIQLELAMERFERGLRSSRLPPWQRVLQSGFVPDFHTLSGTEVGPAE